MNSTERHCVVGIFFFFFILIKPSKNEIKLILEYWRDACYYKELSERL